MSKSSAPPRFFDNIAEEPGDSSDRDSAEDGDVAPDRTARAGHSWLISMTDMVTLMLTFFVFIFSQSAFRNVPFDAVEHRVDGNLEDRFFGRDKYIYGADTRNIPLSLSAQYLYRVLKAQLAHDDLLREAYLSVGRKWVVMSFPGRLFFGLGNDRLEPRAKLALFDIAATLKGLSNRIEVVGYSTPEPYVGTPQRFPTNWYLSFARALEVHRILKDSGVKAPMTIIGRSNALHDKTISSALSNRIRSQLGRRVDIVIYDEKP